MNLEDTIKKRLEEVKSNGHKFYLLRQQLQLQSQQLQLKTVEIEQEMLKLDGEERALESLLEKKNE